jgi:hypothetical protein
MGGMNFRDRTYGFITGLSGISESLTLQIPMRLAFTGTHVSTADGGGMNLVLVPGMLATDYVFAQISASGATPRTILTALPGGTDVVPGSITLTFSGNPSTDHTVKYFVFRTV